VEDLADVLGFDLPTRLAVGGPADGLLPLEPNDAASGDPVQDTPAQNPEEPGQVH
jgi:hypothetical protein